MDISESQNLSTQASAISTLSSKPMTAPALLPQAEPSDLAYPLFAQQTNASTPHTSHETENTWLSVAAPPVRDEVREEFALDDDVPISLSAMSSLPLLQQAHVRDACSRTTFSLSSHNDIVPLHPIDVQAPKPTPSFAFARQIHARIPRRTTGGQARPIAPKPGGTTESQRKSAISFLVGPTDEEQRERRHALRKIAKREAAMRLNARRAAKRKAARAAAAAAALSATATTTATVDNGG